MVSACTCPLGKINKRHLNRGESFRKEYRRLGELRSLVPPECKFIALTATASRSIMQKIMRSLMMWNPITIYVPPQKKNIIYSIKAKESIESMVKPICSCLGEVAVEYPRTIIFCKRFTECTEIYHTFKSQLRDYSTYPSGAPDLVSRARRNAGKITSGDYWYNSVARRHLWNSNYKSRAFTCVREQLRAEHGTGRSYM